MSTDEHKAIVRRAFDLIFNQKRLERAGEVFAQDYVDHGALPGQAPGLEGARWKWEVSIAATPDLRVPIDDILAEGDRVAVRWAWEGTQTGELLGIRPTGRQVRVAGISIVRVAAGKIVEQWEELDRLGLLQQIGAIPSTGDQPAPPRPTVAAARASSPGSSASLEENTAIVRRFHDEVLNAGNVDRADELFTDDYIDHGALPGQAPGLAGAKRKWATVIASMGDLHVPTEDLVAEGDRVAARWGMEGTHRGELLGIPPTGRRVRVGGISIYRLVAGKIAEQWERGDALGLRQQVGAIPAQAVSAVS